jgi:hypothetical protein
VQAINFNCIPFTITHHSLPTDVNYRRIPQPEYLIERIPKKVFDFLSKKYGNDRARFTLYEPSGCKKCSKMETAWDNRRLEEKEAIKKIDISKGTSNDEEESIEHSWYIISTEWISEWHEFMNGGEKRMII